MTTPELSDRSVSAAREVAAPADVIFEAIADPEQQPSWDGNANLVKAEPGQRVHAIGDVFVMTIHNGQQRDNHVVEFEEGRRIAWCPADPGKHPAGHLWRWELEPVGDGRTRVTHTYDWSNLIDERRLERAAATDAAALQSSVDRLAEHVEGHGDR